jgi:hypothetical protein
MASTYHPWANIDVHPHWPREKAYPQDEDPKSYGTTDEERIRFCRAELGVCPLKGAFPLGDMEVILFANTVAQQEIEQLWNRLGSDQ